MQRIAMVLLALLLVAPAWAQTTPAHFSIAYYDGAPLSGLPIATTLYSFRNAGPKTITINCVGVGFITSSSAPVGGWIGIEAVRAHDFTVSDSGGQSLLLPFNASQNRLDSTSDNMTVADVRWSSGSYLVFPGTRTVDAVGFANAAAGVPVNTSAGTVIIPLHMIFEANDAVPLVLHPNEGFILRTFSPWPAGLSANAFFSVEWTEADS